MGKKKVDSQLLVTAQFNNEFLLVGTQLGSDFGVFSLSPLKLYKGSPTDNKPVQNPLKLHEVIDSREFIII